ncbi:MAG: Asp-tRNA(Asn)/Glu-tRNA(Gln) amidotransferase subunit GatC [Eubacteriales bacterium]|nr:Asp-tRNA(Asn)/Glu-tRNA(Gln) amidotransferase subunit GatC [Eubacteriales bacterium]MDD3881617.1 Asp-tRNA(Asn)/Glu-tRNA(Gln) amidotransferase subunit GatC [Eubacteriales bacterium]MDD4512324.1 Asp-tRNA(Asn)/Glu-tRNA(Gln) amidotransferase subunit GatC [Eubacteriales bacterium]
MKIDDEMIDYVSALAKLSLPDDEREKARQDLQSVLEYAQVLSEVDTGGVEPSSHVAEAVNVFREDEIMPSFDKREILKSAPRVKDGQYLVPKTVE